MSKAFRRLKAIFARKNDNLSVSGNADDAEYTDERRLIFFSANRRSPLFSASLCARLRSLRSPDAVAKKAIFAM